MSWSIQTTGTAEEVVRQLEEQSKILTDQSKEEYDAALPHMIALVEQNIGGIINLSASGHGFKNMEGTFTDRICTVNIFQ